MPTLHQAPEIVLGFDVSKDTLTVVEARSSWSSSKPCVIDNTAVAIRRFLKSIGRIDLAVCEPTGGHEHVLLVELMAAGIACHRVDALKVKAFIRSFGTLAKTDALGADFMERWYRTQCARTLETPRHLPEAAASTPPPPTADPWERAIAQARAEIRALSKKRLAERRAREAQEARDAQAPASAPTQSDAP